MPVSHRPNRQATEHKGPGDDHTPGQVPVQGPLQHQESRVAETVEQDQQVAQGSVPLPRHGQLLGPQQQQRPGHGEANPEQARPGDRLHPQYEGHQHGEGGDGRDQDGGVGGRGHAHAHQVEQLVDGHAEQTNERQVRHVAPGRQQAPVEPDGVAQQQRRGQGDPQAGQGQRVHQRHRGLGRHMEAAEAELDKEQSQVDRQAWPRRFDFALLHRQT